MEVDVTSRPGWLPVKQLAWGRKLQYELGEEHPASEERRTGGFFPLVKSPVWPLPCD